MKTINAQKRKKTERFSWLCSNFHTVSALLLQSPTMVQSKKRNEVFLVTLLNYYKSERWTHKTKLNLPSQTTEIKRMAVYETESLYSGKSVDKHLQYTLFWSPPLSPVLSGTHFRTGGPSFSPGIRVSTPSLRTQLYSQHSKLFFT